jgi:hypothetical protein
MMVLLQPKEFETRVQVIQRYPEMRTVEKTDFVKEIHHEERVIIVPKSRIIHDEVERIDRVPVVRQVPQTRMEIVYRVVEEEREVTDMVPEIEYIDVPRIEMVPRVITEDVEERVTVPVVREVPVTRMVEVPTGKYVLFTLTISHFRSHDPVQSRKNLRLHSTDDCVFRFAAATARRRLESLSTPATSTCSPTSLVTVVVLSVVFCTGRGARRLRHLRTMRGGFVRVIM